jgi:hypothetical protein
MTATGRISYADPQRVPVDVPSIPAYSLADHPESEAPSMRIFLGALSVMSLLLAAKRFYLSEDTGYDIGALFLLLIGIQLFVAAILVHEHQQSRSSKQPAATEREERKEDNS